MAVLYLHIVRDGSEALLLRIVDRNACRLEAALGHTDGGVAYPALHMHNDFHGLAGMRPNTTKFNGWKQRLQFPYCCRQMEQTICTGRKVKAPHVVEHSSQLIAPSTSTRGVRVAPHQGGHPRSSGGTARCQHPSLRAQPPGSCHTCHDQEHHVTAPQGASSPVKRLALSQDRCSPDQEACSAEAARGRAAPRALRLACTLPKTLVSCGHTSSS